MNWFAKGAALAGFAALIVVMLVVYGSIERVPVQTHTDRLPSQGAPDSWATRQYDESSNRTMTEYAIDYDNCSLFISKESAALTETIVTVMTCDREVRTANPDYGGPDFAAIWEDIASCGTSVFEAVRGPDGDDIYDITIITSCYGW